MPLLIKKAKKSKSFNNPRYLRSWSYILALVQFPISLIVIVFTLSLITSFKNQGITLTKVGPVVALTDTFESIRAFRFPVLHWFGLSQNLPTIHLDIKQKDYRLLEYVSLHDQNLLNGKGNGESLRREISVKAMIRYEKANLRVKVRLKGDRSVHWKDPQNWSYRVEVKDNSSIFGMRKFSLQKPVTRNYVHEWFFHKLLKREGLIGLRYDFVELKVNGKSHGIYAVEEHFDKILLENNNRREGPILRFSEENIGLNDWYRMSVVPYSKLQWGQKNPEMLRQAANLLEDFQYGRKTLGEVFDVELLARYYAIIDLLDSFHGGLAKSVKFYFNPVNRKLEPIGFDAHFNDRKFPVLFAELSDFREESGYSTPEYYDRIFGGDIRDNIEFWEAYVSELERMSDPDFLDDLFEEFGEELDQKLDILYAETPWQDFLSGHPLTTGFRFWFYFSEQKYYERQSMIQQRLYPIAAITSYIQEVHENHILVQIANGQKLPIEIVDVVLNGNIYRATERILLNQKPRYEQMDFNSYQFQLVGPKMRGVKIIGTDEPVSRKATDSFIRYRVPGAEGVREHEMFNWLPSMIENPNEMKFNRYVAVQSQKFFDIDESSKIISFKTGVWVISSDVVVPEGYTLSAFPGTVIDLRSGARIVSYSPVNFRGTKLDPVIVTTSDATGKGIVVLEASGRSSVSHTRFDGLYLGDSEPWALTSTVTFHRSDVDFDHSFFGNNNSEDSLNIIRSDFSIDNSQFFETSGDAFDSDFSTGSVSNTSYYEIGNDAIDISGSSIVVRNVQMNKIGDKGLSIGESSRMEAEFVSISNVNIAVACKDLSLFDAQNLSIDNAKVGFALFQKKPEYGPAKASVWRTLITNAREKYLVEKGSSFSWDGMPVIPNSAGLKLDLYTNEPEAHSNSLNESQHYE